MKRLKKIILYTQKPEYDKDPRYIDDNQRKFHIEEKINFPFREIPSKSTRIQEEVKAGKDRFL